MGVSYSISPAFYGCLAGIESSNSFCSVNSGCRENLTPLTMSFITINNHQAIPVSSIPEMKYHLFFELISKETDNHPERHCVLYFGFREDLHIRLICCIADDLQHNILITSSVVD